MSDKNTLLFIGALTGIAGIYYFMRDRYKGELPYNAPLPGFGDFEPYYSDPYFQNIGYSEGQEYFGPPLLEYNRAMTLDEIYQKYGNMHGIDWRLLKAIAMVESSERPGVKNPADPSYGLMQVLCSTDNLDPDAQCKNRFNVSGWETATPNRLLEPDFNVSIASQILLWNIKTYGKLKGVAVYNNWSARNAPASGPFPNQGYVDKVVGNYRNLGGTI